MVVNIRGRRTSGHHVKFDLRPRKDFAVASCFLFIRGPFLNSMFRKGPLMNVDALATTNSGAGVID